MTIEGRETERYLKSSRLDLLLVDINVSYNSSSEDLIPVHNGLRSILSYLKRSGSKVDILFELFLPFPSRARNESLIKGIVQSRPRIIGFSPYQSKRNEVNFVAEIEKIVKGCHKKGIFPYVVFGGHFASFEGRHLMEDHPWIDFIVKGEGELTCMELISQLLNKGVLTKIQGLILRGENQIIETPPREAIPDLDSLPFPSHDHLKFAKKKHIKIPTYLVASSRGCYGNCSFCSIRSFYKLSPSKQCWRPHSPKYVVDELEYLANDFNVNYFRFIDDNFIGYGKSGKERAIAIAHEIIKRGLKIRFRLMCRANDVDHKVFSALKMAGLHSVALGIESGSQSALRTYVKETSVETNIKSIQTIDALDLLVILNVIFLNPYTTFKELRENIKFYRFTKNIKNVAWPLEQILFCMDAYSGTPMTERLRSDKMLKGDYADGYYYVFKDERMNYIKEIFDLFLTYNSFFANALLLISHRKDLIDLFRFKRMVFCDTAALTLERAADILEKKNGHGIRKFIKDTQSQLYYAAKWVETIVGVF